MTTDNNDIDQESITITDTTNLTSKQRKKQRYKENKRRKKIEEQNRHQEELNKATKDAINREKARLAKEEEKRAMFRAKIVEKRIQRSSKALKEHVLEKTLKQIGIDKDKFKSDLEAVQKQGGLEINLKN